MSSDPASHTEAKSFFDNVAEDYRNRSEGAVFNTSSASFTRRQDEVSILIRTTPKGGILLDYGMGPAVFGPPAIEHGLDYVGIDISPKMIELAEEMNLPNAEYHLGDLDTLEEFHGRADTVTLIGLIDYLEDPKEGLRQLAACVKSGGRLIVSFRNQRALPTLTRNFCKSLWRLVKPAKPETGGEKNTAFEAPVLENCFVPRKELIPWLEEFGFKKSTIAYLDCSPIFFNMPLPKPVWKLWRWLDATFSCSALSFLCASGVMMAYEKE